MITILKNYSIKVLQTKHQKLIKESIQFLKINKNTAYDRIKEAEKLATKIQYIRKFTLIS
ncbi:Txe/YoeB family toxin of Txe-Axe toxin-antitoxin module [Wenyingzhuangia heitensis]|uniref:Txe/YoeB family toxin of Txe-Axe toxin-antitoxin module n=1 Tax=Wenyingzhuangia heitensis TaxID=1487859 RepID=A0ABX0UBB7_9FLAO|nr:hypothetical protein [Wenyingzhuangia heitensis]NIJ44756.1 Txe/YoeB family toxin of Txe-Axe toxin-antitoxin module [Wenyingzhuangia heitensis]